VVPFLAPTPTDRAGPPRLRTIQPGGGSFEHNARAVIDVLDRMGRQQALMVGHSWGGGVALALAATGPTG